MSWQDAVRLNPTIAYFLLSGEDEARAVSKRFRARYLRASGKLTDQSQTAKAAKLYMAQLRQHYTGEA